MMSKRNIARLVQRFWREAVALAAIILLDWLGWLPKLAAEAMSTDTASAVPTTLPLVVNAGILAVAIIALLLIQPGVHSDRH